MRKDYGFIILSALEVKRVKITLPALVYEANPHIATYYGNNH